MLGKDARSNRVVVGPRAELGTRTVAAEPAVLHRGAARADSVRLRYGAARVPCSVAAEPARVRIDLEREVAAPAPGQTACLMDGDLVVGWGTIADPAGEPGWLTTSASTRRWTRTSGRW